MSSAPSNYNRINFNQKPSDVIKELLFAEFCDEYMHTWNDPNAIEQFKEEDHTGGAVRAIIKYLDVLHEDAKLETHYE